MMSSGEPQRGGSTPPGPSDRELLESLRAGDDEAYAQLWRRHHQAALHAARQHAPTFSAAEDVAAQAFAHALSVVRDGDGPYEAFRAYLLRAVSHVVQEQADSRRGTAGAEDAHGSSGYATVDTGVAVEALDEHYIARAYERLTPEQREILWYVEVERLPLRDAAAILGLSPGATSSRASRGREALSREYIEEHLERHGDNPGCGVTLNRLDGYTRGALTTLQRMRIDRHVGGCASCSLALAELNEIGVGLREVIGPLVLGTAAASYGYFAEMAADEAANASWAPDPVGRTTEAGEADPVRHADATGAAGVSGGSADLPDGLATGLAAGAASGVTGIAVDVGGAAGGGVGAGVGSFGESVTEPSDGADAFAGTDTDGLADAGSPASERSGGASRAARRGRFSTRTAAIAAVSLLLVSGIAFGAVLVATTGDDGQANEPVAKAEPPRQERQVPESTPSSQPESRDDQDDLRDIDDVKAVDDLRGPGDSDLPQESGPGQIPASLEERAPDARPTDPGESRSPSPSPSQPPGPGGNGEPLTLNARQLTGPAWQDRSGVSYIQVSVGQVAPGALVHLEVSAPMFTEISKPTGTVPSRPPLAEDDTWTCTALGTLTASGYECLARAGANGGVMAVMSSQEGLVPLTTSNYDVDILVLSGGEVESGRIHVR